MKTSFFGLFSAAVCIFSTLVAASPVAIEARDVVALDARDTTTALDARDIDILVQVSINIAITAIQECNTNYISYCTVHTCGQSDLVRYSADISVIVTACVSSINGYAGTYSGIEFYDLIGQIFIEINIGLWWMGNHCGLGNGGGLLGGLLGGLVGDILGLVLGLLDSLLYDLTYCLWDLLGCLNIDYYDFIGGLVWGGSSCCLCDLPIVH